MISWIPIHIPDKNPDPTRIRIQNFAETLYAKFTCDHPDDEEDHDNDVVDDVESKLTEAAGHLVTEGGDVLQEPAPDSAQDKAIYLHLNFLINIF